MQLLKFKIQPGQEVMAVLKEEFRKRNLRDGAIVSVIGAVDSCRISNMPKEDAKKDIINEYILPLEISGTGEVKNGEPHIHCTLSKEGEEVFHGHLHEAKIEAWYVAVYVLIE